MVCIMSLLAPAAVTDYGILCTNRAATQNDIHAHLGQIRFEVVLRGRKAR
jgi:hypothetical protein